MPTSLATSHGYNPFEIIAVLFMAAVTFIIAVCVIAATVVFAIHVFKRRN